MTGYNFIKTDGVPIKAWTKGVPVEDAAEQQLRNVAALPFVHRHIAAMPDVHWGKGATVGSVIPCRGAIIPAAVGVDIGCGMMAVQTSLTSHNLPDTLTPLRAAIEAAVPHGRTNNGCKGDRGAWNDVPHEAAQAWSRPMEKRRGKSLADILAEIVAKHPKIAKSNNINHLGTLGKGNHFIEVCLDVVDVMPQIALGKGNHFIEVCLDEADRVWVMLHSGSRGVGNRIGMYFIEKAKEEMRRWHINMPDKELAYLAEGTEHFIDYVKAVAWAQDFARTNREVMMERIIDVMRVQFTEFALGDMAVNCHHNYVAKEKHFGAHVWLTRKGAVRAGEGELGIIPGSMGVRSFIVRGKGNPHSFCSCSHGAGRAMSRTEAKRRYTVADHEQATAGVECRKDAGVIDETPMAYKDIDAVMMAQSDLIEVVHTLKQVVCVKG